MNTPFVREDRYLVIKLKDLQTLKRRVLESLLDSMYIEPVECVVIESDWDVYEDAWKLVEKEAENAE